jgi:hypothetical protein
MEVLLFNLSLTKDYNETLEFSPKKIWTGLLRHRRSSGSNSLNSVLALPFQAHSVSDFSISYVLAGSMRG